MRRRNTVFDEILPAKVLALSTIIQSVEARELWIITEVEFDTGFWEVEIRKDGQKIKLAIDPRNGEISR
ncbi:MAG: hypothetical protein AYP45_01050 [Candidatus Brocadia carolinensis]|uniref:PepSY domain-containing protein n=1 Tax=Candidatus Brocadia carolinensis TaxID=1004156 RepID=A0A1V4AXJ9_9BACT|nr:MAG: hypothetical protein AYP45_01050 [Candidatus Brocadia caroliniensis]